jgi:polyisoprenyl-teichoic acid--peptidoglycan teichoic acid transferase
VRGLVAAIVIGGLGIAIVWAVVALDLAGPGTGTDGAGDPAPPPATGDGGPLDPMPTAVLATFDEEDPRRAATQVTVLGWDRDSGAATILLVPASVTAEVPGHGIASLGDAFAIGEGPLLDAALDNLLSLDLDTTVGISRQAWASLFTRVGGLTIDVPERLRERNADGSATVRFAAGEQFLDGPRLAELLTFRAGDERELDTLPRTQRVLTALLDALAEDPDRIDALLADGAPMLDLTDPESDLPRLEELLTQLAEAQAAGDLVVRTLPVSPLGTGADESYRVDEVRATQLIQDRFAASRPTLANTEGGRRLEIRNGNGVPGVSSEVAQRLIPLGFRVLLTGNADRFDHRETRILVYTDDEEQLAVAREIRDALGLGRIELSEVPQDVVDITIVVGRDYVEARG